LKTLLISGDIQLEKKLSESGMFEYLSISDAFDTEKHANIYDVIVISDKYKNVNEFAYTYDENSELLKNKKLIYMVSNNYNSKVLENITNICESRNIKTIPPKLTVEQIKDVIIEYAFPGIVSKENKTKIITFMGADTKVGATMIAQTCAETLAATTNMKIGLLFLNGNKSTSYINTDKERVELSIDNLKVKLFNNILTSEELENACTKKDNLYILSGLNNVLEMRHYHPEHIEKLIKLASSLFEIIIVDIGSQIELSGGMAVTPLNSASYRYLVTTQQPNSYRNYERLRTQLFPILQVRPEDFLLVVNKYIKTTGIQTPNMLADEYKMTLATYVPNLEMAGWQCEFDNCTLLEYRNEEFTNQIQKLSKLICTQLDIGINDHSPIKPTLFQKLATRIGGVL
jgi:MinD-like ATPase involved in chromosome partitioning or flagellar assembly